jgi:hypothetical protein
MKTIDIITKALNLINVNAAGEAPGANETNEALDILNMMLDQWSMEKLMLYYNVNEIFTDKIIAGKPDYDVGPGEYLDTKRPVKIISCFIRELMGSNFIDTRLELITNDDYQRIGMKYAESTYPKYANYTPTYPNGILRIYPVPMRTLSLGMTQTLQLENLELNDEIKLPAAYLMAIRYNLAVELAGDYGRSINQTIIIKANETKANIKRVNNEDFLMKATPGLNGNKRYNIYTDS